MKSNSRLCAIAMILLGILASAPVFSQIDSVKTTADSTRIDSVATRHSLPSRTPVATPATPAPASSEIVLEEIKIEAVVETPSVALVPKRLTPDFGKMEFVDRSFEKELKAVPKQPMLTDGDLKEVKQIKKSKSNELKSK